MLCHAWEDGYLIFLLVVDGAEPGQVAAERGVSRATLVEQLRDAVGSLACRYEHLANGHLASRFIGALHCGALPASARG